jgi:hypothetical protein
MIFTTDTMFKYFYQKKHYEHHVDTLIQDFHETQAKTRSQQAEKAKHDKLHSLRDCHTQNTQPEDTSN